MQRLTIFFRIITVGMFLAILLYIYAILPEQVIVFKDSVSPSYILKSSFFYTALAVFFIINVLIFAAIFFLKKNFLTGIMTNTIIFWLNGLSGFLNIFFGLSVVAIWALNINYSNVFAGSMFYGGLFLVFVWMLSLVYFIKKPDIANH